MNNLEDFSFFLNAWSILFDIIFLKYWYQLFYRTFYKITWQHNLQERNQDLPCHENLKSQNMGTFQ
jgi:hypothetical protein